MPGLETSSCEPWKPLHEHQTLLNLLEICTILDCADAHFLNTVKYKQMPPDQCKLGLMWSNKFFKA